MRIKFTSRLSLLLLSFVAAMLIFPAMAFAEPIAPDGSTSLSPTIQSDKADYTPGELVTLTGSNWQPGESVNIKVNDTYGATWSRNVEVTADAHGQITDTFNLPDWFVSDYDVTATGAQSGVATTTFTDGNIKVRSAGGNNFGFTFQGFTGSANCSTAAGATQSGTADNNGQNVVSNAGQSALITANTNANAPNASLVFINWSNPDGLTITGNLNSRTICVAGFGNGTRDLIGNYGRQTNTTVARTGGPNPSTYGTALTFTATVTATGGDPSGVGTVTFKDGANTISGCTNVALSGNTATCVTSKLSAGAHNNITAEYSGVTTGATLFSSSTSAPISHTVNQKALTVNGVTANSKVYDGNTSATILTRSLSGVIAGDTVNLTGGTATFDNANVGMGKTVTATGFTLTGTDAGNYSLAAGPWTATASIYYNYSGFLQPINDTAHQTGLLQSKFKLGQTIPVKFQLRDAAGNLVQQATNPIFTKSGNRGACDAATTVETPPLVTPDPSNQYIYTGGQYHYNWSTKGLTAGEYRIYANLADGTQPYVDICLTK